MHHFNLSLTPPCDFGHCGQGGPRATGHARLYWMLRKSSEPFEGRYLCRTHADITSRLGLAKIREAGYEDVPVGMVDEP